MPYIEQRIRGGGLSPGTPGELNFWICCVLIEYVNRRGLNYQTINDISGAMAEAMAEFRRRVVAPYEDKKIEENGDLPWPK